MANRTPRKYDIEKSDRSAHRKIVRKKKSLRDHHK